MTIRTRLLALALTACALGTGSAAGQDAVRLGRLSGLTQITYGCPGPAREGAACEHWLPFAHARFAVTMSGPDRSPVPGTRRLVVSDSRGHFALSLAAGRYTLTPLPQSHTRGGAPVSVRIRAGGTATVAVRFLGFPMMV
jgi:hypothetical protein